jgi:ATP-dependent DNA helicase RecG
MKEWVDRVVHQLTESLRPLPQEPNELDWKESLSPNKRRLTEHLSAMANLPGGGTLVFGIDNKNAKAIGIGAAEAETISSQLANLAREALEVKVRLDHAVIDWEGVPLLLVHVMEAAVKPVHLRGKDIEHSFIRSGGTTRSASRQEIGAMMLHSKNLRWEELRTGLLMTGDEVLAKLEHERILNLLERPAPTATAELLACMEAEKLVERVDDSGFYITNFGGIAAARKLADFDNLARKTVRVVIYKGLNKAVTEREYEGSRGYAGAFQGLLRFLGTILPQSEIIQKALRKKVTIYPEIALRELIANALIHQDFSLTGAGPMVEIFADRIEIRSPGRLLPSKKIDRLIGTQPESRNELLAKAFRRYKICEERGSGLLKAGLEIELYGLPPLQFEDGENYFKVTMHAPRTFAQMSLRERISACYQHAVIRHLSSGAMTNTSLRERLKMPEKQRAMVSALIKETLNEGLIKRSDPESTSLKFSEYIPYWA